MTEIHIKARNLKTKTSNINQFKRNSNLNFIKIPFKNFCFTSIKQIYTQLIFEIAGFIFFINRVDFSGNMTTKKGVPEVNLDNFIDIFGKEN